MEISHFAQNDLIINLYATKASYYQGNSSLVKLFMNYTG